MSKISKTKAELALAAVAKWLGEKKGMWETATCPHSNACATNKVGDWPAHKDGSMCPKPKFGPAPTGSDAAQHALGPELVMDWSWPSEPTPTILLEGGPYDWAIEAAYAVKMPHGVFAEPYAGYALCLYPDN